MRCLKDATTLLAKVEECLGEDHHALKNEIRDFLGMPPTHVVPHKPMDIVSQFLPTPPPLDPNWAVIVYELEQNIVSRLNGCMVHPDTLPLVRNLLAQYENHLRGQHLMVVPEGKTDPVYTGDLRITLALRDRGDRYSPIPARQLIGYTITQQREHFPVRELTTRYILEA